MADEGKHRGTARDVIFLHHSTGRNIIAFDDGDGGGDVRARLAARDIDFWDHDYPGDEAIHRPDGSATSDYGVDNTDPDGFYYLFCEGTNGDLAKVLSHGTIMFKSCYPTCHIDTGAKLDQYKTYYDAIADVQAANPARLFIPFTPPPLHPLATNSDEAALARAFSGWMVSKWKGAGLANVEVFNLFDILAEETLSGPESNMLEEGYRRDSESKDSHPNDAANEVASAALVEFVAGAVEATEERRGGIS